MLEAKKIKHKKVMLTSSLINEDTFNFIEYKSSKTNTKTFFLIAPTADGADFWLPFLKHSSPQYNYIAVGLPGFEEGSNIVGNSYSVKELAMFYSQVIKELNLDQLIIMGMSISVPVSHELAYIEQKNTSNVILMGGGEFLVKPLRYLLRPLLFLMLINTTIRNIFFKLASCFIPMLRNYDQSKLRASIQHVSVAIHYSIQTDIRIQSDVLLLRGALDTVVDRISYTKFKRIYMNSHEEEFKYNHKISDGNVEEAIQKTMPMIFRKLEQF